MNKRLAAAMGAYAVLIALAVSFFTAKFSTQSCFSSPA